MKKVLFLLTLVALFVSGAMAQEKAKITNFAGDWTLDVSKSKLGERSRVESMTMKVAQTEKELTVTTAVKRQAPPEGAPQGGGTLPQGGVGGRMGGGMGGMRGGMGDGTTTYNLDGKETTTEGMMGGQATLKAKFEQDGKLKLSRSQSMETPNGSFTIGSKESWELSADGKTLTVKRDIETPRGTMSSEMVFTKQ